MRTAPAAKDNWGIKEADRLMSAMFGAAYSLTSLRADLGRDYEQWLTLHAQDPEAAKTLAARSIADESGTPRAIKFGSDLFFTHPRFDLTTRFAPSTNAQLDPDLPAALEAAALTAQTNAATVLGKVHMAPIRLYIADQRGFASLASNTYMGGQAEVNRIILRLGETHEMRQVMTHEYVHILHAATHERQPRWLSEGFAESIAAGTRPEPWTTDSIRILNLDRAVAEGVFTRLIGWSDSASNDAREGENYRLAHVAVDFLRYGPFPAADTRLALLMASYSQGRNDRDVFATWYGMDAKALDLALRAWLMRP
jgi:hypothetical protein